MAKTEKPKPKAKHGFMDRVLHPGHDPREDDDGLEALGIKDDAQKQYEDQGQASAQASANPKPKATAGSAKSAADYQNHPKFAKFKGRT